MTEIAQQIAPPSDAGGSSHSGKRARCFGASALVVLVAIVAGAAALPPEALAVNVMARALPPQPRILWERTC